MASNQTSVFVTAGRKTQLERLQVALARALAGQPQVVLVAGDAGTGKTTLAREFCRRAQQTNDKLIVANGQCSTPQGDPYLPFKKIIATWEESVRTS